MLSLSVFAMSGCSSTSQPGEFLTLNPGPFRASYLIPDQSSEFDTLELIVQAGESDNTGSEGLAHYVEHLAWLPQLVTDGQASSRHSNAWTSKLATGYFISGPTEDTSHNLTRLLSVSEPYQLTEKFMLEEQRIILREYESRVGENQYYPLYREIEHILYGNSPLARSPLGTRESIDTFSIDAARRLHQATHVLPNMVLVVRGGVSAQALQAELDLLGVSAPLKSTSIRVPAHKLIRDEAVVNVPGIASQEIIYTKLVSIPEALSGARLSVVKSLLESILDSALPGGIAGPLRFDEFVASSFDFNLFYDLNTHLEMRFSARPDIGVSLPDLVEAFEQALTGSMGKGLPVDTYVKVKERFLTDLLAVEDKSEFTYDSVRSQVSIRRVPFSYYDVVTAAKALTVDDVNLLYRALAGEGRVVIRHLYPEL